MITANFNANHLVNTIKNVVSYSEGYIQELNSSKEKIARDVTKDSVRAFYDFLDGLALAHPGMLHHVYEWGQVGNPTARLFELSTQVSRSTGVVTAEFLQSDSISETSSEPFVNKAEIMEDGIPVVINEKDAQALFFVIDGEEFFRVGPIYIANPGGSSTRGSFVKAFDEFYGRYFEEVYLKAIGFYKHFASTKEYSKYFKNASKSKSARSIGKQVAKSWVTKGLNL
jgi:hypothetical protein